MATKKFIKWIKDNGGPRPVSRMLDLETAAVRQWLIQKCSPRPRTMQKLVKLGKGAFDFNDIIDDTVGNRNPPQR